MRYIVALVTLTLCAEQVLALPTLSGEVLASELQLKYVEYLPKSKIAAKVVDPLLKSMGKNEMVRVSDVLQHLKWSSVAKLDEMLDKLTSADRVVSKKIDFRMKFYDPCVDFLAKLGRYVEAYENRSSSTSFDHIARVPLAISETCKGILSTQTARCVVNPC